MTNLWCAASVILLSLTVVGQTNVTRDCSLLPGATADVVLNACNAMALTTKVSTMDARGINGVQTIASQVNIGEFLPPVVTAVTGGNVPAGTYRLIYTFNAPSLPCAIAACTESEASEEFSITLADSVHNLQFNSPTYTGAATSYNIYLTSGAIWTEKKCSAGFVNVSIGTNVTLNAAAVTACTGGTTTVSPSNTGVTLLLPSQGHWQCTITDGIHACLKWFDHASIIGWNSGYGQPFKIESASASTNVSFLCGADLDEKTVGQYVKLQGFECNNNINGTGTMSGGTDVRNSAAVPGAIFMQSQTIDTARFDDVHAFNGNGANGSGTVACLIYGGGGGAAFYNLGCDGGGSSGSNGGPSMQIGLASAAITTEGLTFYGSSIVHPGATFNSVKWINSGNAISFNGIYMETNLGSSCDTTTPLIDIGTGGGVGGPVSIRDVYVGAACSGSTAPIIQVENNFTGTYQFVNIASGSATMLAVNDKLYVASSPANKIGVWPPPTGLSVTSGKLPTCNGPVAQTGALWTANNCNAACVAGNSCTGGGANVCQMVCNHSNAWVMTGVTE
jgi:hypothetical protein